VDPEPAELGAQARRQPGPFRRVGQREGTGDVAEPTDRPQPAHVPCDDVRALVAPGSQGHGAGAFEHTQALLDGPRSDAQELLPLQRGRQAVADDAPRTSRESIWTARWLLERATSTAM